MYRLSLIISEIYNKYLPLAEKDGIILNLDFSDTTKTVADPDRVKSFLDEHLSDTLKRSAKDGNGEVTIGVSSEAITITDSATTLSPAACALLSNRYINVSSRVGFGTTVKIFFKPQEPTATEISAPKPELTIESVSGGINVDNNSKNTVVESKVNLTAKTGKQPLNLGARLKLTSKDKSKKASKTTAKAAPKKSLKAPAKLKAAQTKRQLKSAAKKADKEVKRIAKKASKEAKKLEKQTKKLEKSTRKTSAKTKVKNKANTTPKAKKTKKKLELS